MAYFLCAFRIELLRRLRSRSSFVFLALAAALTVWMLLGPGADRQAVVQVGLVLPEEGHALEELLLDRSSELVLFLLTDEATLARKVLSGQWDCGLVASEDFAEKLEALDMDDLFTLKTGPGSAVYPLVQETVAACVMELISPAVAEDYLTENGMDPTLREQSPGRVDVLLETLEGEEMSPLELTSSTGRRTVRGLSVVLALIWGLYLCVDLGRWLGSAGAARLLCLRSLTELLLPRLSATLLPVLLWGAGLLWGLGGARAAVTFCAFLAVVLALGLVLPRWRTVWQSALVLMPFLTVGSLLLEPVLIDVQSPPWLGWLPVTLCCKACDGSDAALLFLLLEALLLTALSLLLDHISRKRRKR